MPVYSAMLCFSYLHKECLVSGFCAETSAIVCSFCHVFRLWPTGFHASVLRHSCFASMESVLYFYGVRAVNSTFYSGLLKGKTWKNRHFPASSMLFLSFSSASAAPKRCRIPCGIRRKTAFSRCFVIRAPQFSRHFTVFSTFFIMFSCVLSDFGVPLHSQSGRRRRLP